MNSAPALRQSCGRPGEKNSNTIAPNTCRPARRACLTGLSRIVAVRRCRDPARVRSSRQGWRGVRASFAHAGEQQFNATLTYPSGEVRGYVLRGDEWQIDARVLKWRGVANVLNFDTAYRLERISGRYSDVERERTEPRTVYALHAP